MRLNAIRSTISVPDDVGYHPEKPKELNCPNQVSTKFWTSSSVASHLIAIMAFVFALSMLIWMIIFLTRG